MKVLSTKMPSLPWMFIRREWRRIYQQNVSFNSLQGFCLQRKKTIAIPENTQDLISAFIMREPWILQMPKKVMCSRLWVISTMPPSLLTWSFLGREEIKSKKGTFRCVKFRPMLQEGRVFKDQGRHDRLDQRWQKPDSVWVQTDILIGSIKMDLVGFENLANEPALVK